MEIIEQELPMGWVKAALDDVTAILDSQRIPINNGEREKRLIKADNLYPYYGATGRVGDIDDYIFDGEAILLGEDAAPFLEFGKDKAYLAHGKYWVNNHAHILRGYEGIDNHFVCHQLNILDYREFVSGTTRLKLTQGSMKNMRLRIAPFNEQKRIVDKIEQLFSNLDEGEALLKQVQKQLATYRQSVLKSAVTGELTKEWREENKHRLESGEGMLSRITGVVARGNLKKYKEPDSYKNDFSKLQKLPQTWAWTDLDNLILESQNGISKRRGESGVETIVLRLADISTFALVKQNLRTIVCSSKEIATYGLVDDDILVVRVNGSEEIVGKFIRYRRRFDNEELFCDHFIRLRPIKDVRSAYICLYARSKLARDFIRDKKVCTAGQNTINQSSLLQMPISIPSIEEQDLIIEKVENIYSQIGALESWCVTELARSTTLRQSILKDAFSGKLVPQDSSDEPASELLKRIQAERVKGIPLKKQKASSVQACPHRKRVRKT